MTAKPFWDWLFYRFPSRMNCMNFQMSSVLKRSG